MNETTLVTAIMLGLSLALGPTVVLSSHGLLRAPCQGQPASPPLGCTALGAAAAAARPPRPVTTKFFADAVAGLAIVSALVSFFAPQVVVDAEEPRPPVGEAETVQIVTSTAAVAIVLLLLAAAFMALAAAFTWRIHTTARQLADAPSAFMETVLVWLYIVFVHCLPLVAFVVRDQVEMRRHDFHLIMGWLPASWAFLTSFLVGFVLHAVFTGAAVRQLWRNCLLLEERRHLLRPQVVADLEQLYKNGAIYAIIASVLYFVAFFAYIIYPWSLHLTMTATPYHLALLVLLHCCFGVGPSPTMVARSDLHDLASPPLPDMEDGRTVMLTETPQPQGSSSEASGGSEPGANPETERQRDR